MTLLLTLCFILILLGIMLLINSSNSSIINLQSFAIKIYNISKSFASILKENSYTKDFVKGIKHAASFPLLPTKLTNYHNSLLGRTLRVIGGFSAYILLTYKSEISPIENLADNEILYYLIGFVGLFHLFYMLAIFMTKLLYIIYYLIRGDWIHRN